MEAEDGCGRSSNSNPRPSLSPPPPLNHLTLNHYWESDVQVLCSINRSRSPCKSYSHLSIRARTHTHARTRTNRLETKTHPTPQSVGQSVSASARIKTNSLHSCKAQQHTQTQGRALNDTTHRRHARSRTLGCTLHNTHRHTPFWSDPLPTWLKKDKRGCELQQTSFPVVTVCVCVCVCVYVCVCMFACVCVIECAD